jgi:non-heme chloroperoxidase
VIAQLGRPPALVGASLGGLTSLLAIGEAEVQVATAAVLVDIAPRIEPEGAQRITSFMVGRPDGYASLDEVADAIADYTRQRSRRAISSRSRRTSASSRTAATPGTGTRASWAPTDQPRSSTASACSRPRAGSRYPRSSCAVAKATSSPITGVQEFLSHLPNAQYVDVGGAGHMVAGDRNDAFTEAVRAFLARAVPLSSRYRAGK